MAEKVNKRYTCSCYNFCLFVCLCWGFTAQSTQWGHVKCRQFTKKAHQNSKFYMYLNGIGPLANLKGPYNFGLEISLHISATCVLRQIGIVVSWDEIFISVIKMLKRQHIGDLFAPFWNMATVFRIPKTWFFNKKSKKFRLGLLGLLLAITVLKLGVWLEYWRSLRKRRRDSRLTLLYKGMINNFYQLIRRHF